MARGGDIDPTLPDYPSMVHALDFAAEHVPDRVAMVCEADRVTFTQYRRAVAGLAHELRRLGARGERVAIMLNTSIEMAVACLGGMAAGAQIAPLNPAYTEHELNPLLRDADPTVIVCEPSLAARARALGAGHGIGHVVVLGEGGIPLSHWTEDAGLALPDDLPGPDDLSAMFFTGGTTGVPKGADHTHAMMLSHCRQTASQWPMRFDRESILSVAPMFHIWGHHFANLMPLYLRATLVAVPRYKPAVVLDAFERHAITVFAGGPSAIYVGLLGDPAAETTDFSALRHCLAGGAPCSEELLRAWERRTGCPILEAYGMSEGAPVSGNPIDGVRKWQSVGPLAPLTEADIVDLETGTTVLPAYERGEIRVRGPQFTRGYHGRPDETAIANRDGWFYTGDIGYLDDDGYLFIVDRKKEMIIVGGYNVYPREVDEVLHGHPAVHEAATVGVPDEFLGEVVKAFVALVPGAEASEDALIAYCADRLVKYKVPVAVAFMAALPKTGANKIDKLALKGARS
jgi:long-chain acyl-CoA synthetase